MEAVLQQVSKQALPHLLPARCWGLEPKLEQISHREHDAKEEAKHTKAHREGKTTQKAWPRPAGAEESVAVAVPGSGGSTQP